MPKKSDAKGAAALWIRAVRGDLTQEAFAAKLGVDRVTVSNWERGDAQPGFENMERIARTFPDAPAFAGSRAQVGGTTGMSEGRSTGRGARPNLEIALERHADRLTLRQAERIRGLRPRVEKPGTELTADQWEAVILFILADEPSQSQG